MKASLSIGWLLLTACATSQESVARQNFRTAFDERAQVKHTAAPARPVQAPQVDAAATTNTPTGRAPLASCIRLALEHSPHIAATFQRWKAAVHAIAPSRRLPEPTLTFGYFLSAIETRLGPQIARVGVQQWFPWPTALSRSADAAALRAEAVHAQLNADTLGLVRQVSDLYWQLWLNRRMQLLHHDHQIMLQGVQSSVNARIAIGRASIADSGRVSLAATRTNDTLARLAAVERGLKARLQALMGHANSALEGALDAPPLRSPTFTLEALSRHVENHPRLRVSTLQASAETRASEAEASAAYPKFGLGAEWLVVGQGQQTPAPPRAGDDAFMVSAAVSIPLWQNAYDEAAAAKRGNAAALLLESQSQRDALLGELHATVVEVDDTQRQVALVQDALLPQVGTTLQSVLGGLMTGTEPLTAALQLEQEALELRVELAQAQAAHARAWARLEELAAMPLADGAADLGSTAAPATPAQR